MPTRLWSLIWVHGIPIQGVAATAGLIAIQVGIGIVMKAAQVSGSYSFSPSASIVISEFLKLLLSTFFFWRESEQRSDSWPPPSSLSLEGGAGPQYSRLDGDDRAPAPENAIDDSSQAILATDHGDPSDTVPAKDQREIVPSSKSRLSFFLHEFSGDLAQQKTEGIIILALCYTLINNSIFLSYKIADPGTIQLSKSGGTVVTAIIMVVCLGTTISHAQWTAIAIQLCGLILTQYKGDSKTLIMYPVGVYLILVLQLALSASAGVYNQYLVKLNDCSLHVNNMILYAAGASINLVCHLVLRCVNANEPGFFHGYDSVGAIMVVLSNVFIGLAITIVYKYADALIKCFASAVSTGILLYLSPILFGTVLGDLVIIGAGLTFFASWLYISRPAPQKKNQTTDRGPQSNNRIFAAISGIFEKYTGACLGMLTFGAVILVVFLAIPEQTMPGLLSGTTARAAEVITSPFQNTFAMVRWNTRLPERIPLIKKYEPFFRAVHVSMPELDKERPAKFHDWETDQAPNTFTIYSAVARSMKMILSTQPLIDGLLYFHFDAWIDPLAWGDLDRNNIWFLNSSDPVYGCMNNTKTRKWWGLDKQFHLPALNATRIVDELDAGYEVQEGYWCIGWSDIYYIPRRFFVDYILLADIFYEYEVFHEVAIPTMVRIINDTYSHSDAEPAVHDIRDCWGSCCSTKPSIENVTMKRCGHKLDYLSEPLRTAFFDKLDGQAQMLGLPAPRDERRSSNASRTSWG